MGRSQMNPRVAALLGHLDYCTHEAQGTSPATQCDETNIGDEHQQSLTRPPLRTTARASAKDSLVTHRGLFNRVDSHQERGGIDAELAIIRGITDVRGGG